MRTLFDAHYNETCIAIYKIVRQQSVAEDLAQDVFVRFWEKRETINITTSIGAYIHRMAVNEGLGYLRKNKKKKIEEFDARQHSGQTISDEDKFIGTELQERIHRAISTLPTRCQEVFRLSRFEELSYKEIAARLDISVKTVENQMGKALRVLRELLKDDLVKVFLLWWWL